MTDELYGRKPYFDRSTTAIVKGIAVIMMFVHHFYTFPSWLLEEISYSGIEVFAHYFCTPLKLCVAIFCFITGYFYYFNKNRTYRYSFKKILDIMITYWVVFFIFAAIAVAFADYHYTFSSFLKECVAQERPTMFFCWYVKFYFSFMLVIPLVTRIMSRNMYLDLLMALVLLPKILTVAGNYLTSNAMNEAQIIGGLAIWLPIVLEGYIFASYGIFEKIESKITPVIRNRWVNAVLLILIGFLSLMGRLFEPSLHIILPKLPSLDISMDIIYTPVFIYVVVCLCKIISINPLKVIVSQIGKYALLMWFVSCMFFNNCKQIFQPILYYPHNPILVTIWGLILCYFISVFFDFFIRKIRKLVNQIGKKPQEF